MEKVVQDQVELVDVLDREAALHPEALDPLRQGGDLAQLVAQGKALFQDHDVFVPSG